MKALITLTLMLLMASVVHECGHWLMCKAVGARTYGFTLALGVFPALKRDYASTGLRNALVSLAGPLASILVGTVMWVSGWQLAAMFCLLFAADIVPLHPACDGWKALSYLGKGKVRQNEASI